jgi:hypothetical protein
MVAILHEGKDDKKYIKRVLEFLNIENYSNDTFYEMNNKSNFFKTNHINYRTLKQKIENDEITKVLFILDADYKTDSVYGGVSNTTTELEKIISELGFFNNYEIYVVCEPGTAEGYFETLFLSCVSDELKECYQKFIECTGFTGKEPTKTIMTKLHELSSPEKPYSFEHANFKPLKDTLTNLFNT